MGISGGPRPPGPLHFLYRNTSAVKNRFLLKKWRMWKVDIAKTIWEINCKSNGQTVFIKCSIVDVWQGSEYALVSDFEYTRVLNLSGLHRVLNMPECAQIIFEHTWICLDNFWTYLNMPKYVWICLNLPEWLLFYFPILILNY